MRTNAFLHVLEAFVLLVLHYPQKSTQESSVSLRDQFPTRCYTLLDPSFTSPDRVAAARLNLCNGADPKCACSCDPECLSRHTRLQRCCQAKGVHPNCLSLCRYDVDEVEFQCKAKECSVVMQIWMYCAADSPDPKKNVECCRKAGLPELCSNEACAGHVPRRRDFTIHHIPCTFRYADMLRCFVQNLPRETSWDKDGKIFPPQLEPYKDWQWDMIIANTPEHCR